MDKKFSIFRFLKHIVPIAIVAIFFCFLPSSSVYAASCTCSISGILCVPPPINPCGAGLSPDCTKDISRCGGPLSCVCKPTISPTPIPTPTPTPTATPAPLKPPADSAVPPPYVKCGEVRPDFWHPYFQGVPIYGKYTEFQSLRPYQESPCTTQTASYANYCGNDLTVKDTIIVNYPGSENYLTGTGCTQTGNKVNCNYLVPVSKTITINLTGANLPIMGNTEDVINSQNPIKNSVESTEGLTNADKMNKYVSWYLNGAIDRAEYPYLDKSIASAEKIVDYSGPLNKLLPQDIQFASRSATVKQAGVTRHNQIVGCSLDVDPSVLGLLGDLFNIGNIHLLDIPIPCDSTGFLNLLETVSHVKKEHRLDEWSKNNNLPPLMSDYPKYADYLKAYKEWQGKACGNVIIPKTILGIPIPIIGGQTILLCVDDVFKSKFNSYLFQNIPLSSTEDTKGYLAVDEVSTAANPNTNGITLSGVTFTDQTGTGSATSTLFFPHMEESNQLGGLLQDTYTPKGVDQVGSPTNIAAETSCKSVEVRSNKGDNLFASSITGILNYTANFTCQFDSNTFSPSGGEICARVNHGQCYPSSWSCDSSSGQVDCGTGLQCGTGCVPVIQTCKKDVFIALSTTSSTPLVDDIWSRLVAGPMAIFKRIFPKTNTEGSVGQIIDIAGSTNITFTGDNIDTTNADLKFPHIGGISEYFLKGIQTALRPKGYGDTLEFAQNSENSCKTGTMPTLPVAQGACVLKSTVQPGTSSLQMPPTLVSILQAASQTYNVPPGLIAGIMYGEGLFVGSNKKNWTEENVKSWATCGKVPGCSETGDDHFMGFNGSDWDGIKGHILSDLQKLDPTKKEADRCNLLDAIYGEAWNLHATSQGGGSLPATCFGISLKAPPPRSCTWMPEQYESAIKVAESGYTSACFTNKGGCSGGKGMSAACLNGDTCETIYNRYPVTPVFESSHNACIWDVAHSH